MLGDHLLLSYLPGSLLHPVALSPAKGSHSSCWHFSDKWMFLLWDLGVTFICRLEGGICHQYEVSKSHKVSSTAPPHQHLTDAFSRAGVEGPNSYTLETKLSAYEPLRNPLKPNWKTPPDQGESSHLPIIYPDPRAGLTQVLRNTGKGGAEGHQGRWCQGCLGSRRHKAYLGLLSTVSRAQEWGMGLSFFETCF